MSLAVDEEQTVWYPEILFQDSNVTQAKVVRDDILIVDDKPANLKVLASMLAGKGYNVRPAINGELALSAIREAPPDLILLDVSMPGLDGYEVCRRLKSDEDAEIRHIPVIFISARAEVEDQVKGFELGGVDYVTKPFQAHVVLARIETHLKIRRLQRQLEKEKADLREALDNIDALRGLIPMCAACKKIRDDEGFWQQVDAYISRHSGAQFTHGLCPDCVSELYPDFHPGG